MDVDGPTKRLSTAFGVSNFKGITSAKLALGRLTVLAGANSSGKSSLLQALLFLAQSFSEPTTVLNGNLVRLGEPRDVIRDGMDSITLWLDYLGSSEDTSTSRRQEEALTLSISLAAHGSPAQLVPVSLTVTQGPTTLIHAELVSGASGPDRAPQETLLEIKQPVLSNAYVGMSGLRPTRVVYRANEEALTRAFDRLVDALPDRPLIAASQMSRTIRKSAPALIEGLTPRSSRKATITHFVQFAKEKRAELLKAYLDAEAPNGWASEPIESTRKELSPEEEEPVALVANEMVRILSGAVSRVSYLSRAIVYLGPLRDEPRIAYPLGHTVRTLPVGEKGEFTAAYLQQARDRRVKYLDPDGVTQRDSLSNAASIWCHHLGIADGIQVITRGKLGHQLGLNIAGVTRDPTAVGVGASQLLPVVVLVLGAPQDAVVLLEQPELHLHPGVQSRLGDFFARARPDVRLVIETHSEYLVTRLRRLIAEGDLAPSDLSVLFASHAREPDGPAGGETRFRALDVDELGDFDVWPDGFFDALDHESVNIARAVVRRVAEDNPPSV